MNLQSQIKPVILVIDPDPMTMTAIAASMHLSGYESYCAQDGEAAIKAAQETSFDLIICDVNIDGENGIELCREIHELPKNVDAPVMYISAGQMPDIIRRSNDDGSSYYLRKPFDPKVLLELVERALWMPHLIKTNIKHGAEPIRDAVSQGMGRAEEVKSL